MFLAELIGFSVHDSRGAAYRLVDLAIDTNGEAEPTVRRLHLRTGALSRRVVQVPATLVERVDVWSRSVLIGDDPRSDALAVPPEPRREAHGGRPLLRLKEDLLDALVIDLETRRATRINDLWLDADAAGIRLVAADLSLAAMLRRITRGRVRAEPAERDLVAWASIEFFRGDLSTARAAGDRHERLGLLTPAEIARLADALPYPMTVELVGLLPDELATDVFEALPEPRQLQVLESLSLPEQGRLVGRASARNAAAIVAQLDLASATALLEAVPAERRQPIVELLRYPRDSVGAVMTNAVATVPVTAGVGEALGLLRSALRRPDFVYFVYVVDDAERLAGVVTLRDLLVSDPAAAVADVMNRHLETVHALDPAKEAAHRLIEAQLLAFPVLGLEGRLVGALTVDVSVGLVAPEAWRRRAPRVFS